MQINLNAYMSISPITVEEWAALPRKPRNTTCRARGKALHLFTWRISVTLVNRQSRAFSLARMFPFESRLTFFSNRASYGAGVLCA